MITGGNCCNISVLVQNDGEDGKSEQYMMLESKTDQLLASLKPTARPHVDIELVRCVVIDVGSLCLRLQRIPGVTQHKKVDDDSDEVSNSDR